jgi:hypothetical protein
MTGWSNRPTTPRLCVEQREIMPGHSNAAPSLACWMPTRSGSPVQRGRDLQPNKDVVLMSADLSDFELSGVASVAETGSS